MWTGDTNKNTNETKIILFTNHFTRFLRIYLSLSRDNTDKCRMFSMFIDHLFAQGHNQIDRSSEFEQNFPQGTYRDFSHTSTRHDHIRSRFHTSPGAVLKHHLVKDLSDPHMCVHVVASSLAESHTSWIVMLNGKNKRLALEKKQRYHSTIYDSLRIVIFERVLSLRTPVINFWTLMHFLRRVKVERVDNGGCLIRGVDSRFLPKYRVVC